MFLWTVLFIHFALYDSKNQQCIQLNVFPDNEQWMFTWDKPWHERPFHEKKLCQMEKACVILGAIKKPLGSYFFQKQRKLFHTESVTVK